MVVGFLKVKNGINLYYNFITKFTIIFINTNLMQLAKVYTYISIKVSFKYVVRLIL